MHHTSTHTVSYMWNVSLPSALGGSGLEGERLRLVSPVETAAGRATEYPPPPLLPPTNQWKRKALLSLHVNFREHASLAASKLWYQNSPGSLCLKNAPADPDAGDRGRGENARSWNERKHRRTTILLESEERSKGFVWLFNSVVYCKLLKQQDSISTNK